MKIYIVLYLYGQIAGVSNSLPITMDECQKAVRENMSVITMSSAATRDFQIRCEMRADRPVLTYKGK